MATKRSLHKLRRARRRRRREGGWGRWAPAPRSSAGMRSLDPPTSLQTHHTFTNKSGQNHNSWNWIMEGSDPSPSLVGDGAGACAAAAMAKERTATTMAANGILAMANESEMIFADADISLAYVDWFSCNTDCIYTTVALLSIHNGSLSLSLTTRLDLAGIAMACSGRRWAPPAHMGGGPLLRIFALRFQSGKCHASATNPGLQSWL